MGRKSFHATHKDTHTNTQLVNRNIAYKYCLNESIVQIKAAIIIDRYNYKQICACVCEFLAQTTDMMNVKNGFMQSQ